MKTEKLKYVGIDGFNRPIFRGDGHNHFGCCDILFSHYTTKEEVLSKVTEKDITYFGSYFDCEPMGTSAPNIKIERS